METFMEATLGDISSCPQRILGGCSNALDKLHFSAA